MNINEDSLEGSIESPKGKGKEPEIPDTLSKENLMLTSPSPSKVW